MTQPPDLTRESADTDVADMGAAAAPAVAPWVAVALACGAMGLLSLMDVVMKLLVLDIGVYNSMLWRGLAGSLMGGMLFLWFRPAWPGRAAMRLHLWRGFLVTCMALLFFWGLGRLPLAEAIALSFIAPLIALYLAALILGEAIGRAAIFASVLGVAGVGIILSGRMGGDVASEAALPGVAAVLASAILYAYSLILGRQQAQIARPVEIAFFQNITIFFTLLVIIPLGAALWNGAGGLLVDELWRAAPEMQVPPADAWPAIFGAAALAFISLLMLSWAYARAEAQILIPVEYTAFVWAAGLGWVFLDEVPGWATIGGTILIVTGCLIAARASTGPAAHIEETSL
jgi:S-adenosylmethionine uptake transporter